jgi:hypothetical protein
MLFRGEGKNLIAFPLGRQCQRETEVSTWFFRFPISAGGIERTRQAQKIEMGNKLGRSRN